jgi:hypothetical protein
MADAAPHTPTGYLEGRKKGTGPNSYHKKGNVLFPCISLVKSVQNGHPLAAREAGM